MDLSEEERKKIYEEEKAKIDARAQAEKEKKDIPLESSTSLAPRVAGLLCYLGAWVTGIVFIVIEQKNKWVRFHAAQAIVTFGVLWIAGMILGNIPYVKYFFSPAISILGVILWIVLMVKAYNGERYKLPWAGDLAEMIIGSTGTAADPAGTASTVPPPQPQAPAPPAQPQAPEQPVEANAFPEVASTMPEPKVAEPVAESVPEPVAEPAVNSPPPPPPPPPASSMFIDADEKTNRKIDAWFSHGREGRVTGSAFIIAFDIILLVFLNFFNKYVAYYSAETVDGVVRWTRDPFFTSDIGTWLPIFNAALAVSIICHIVMIIVDKDLLRQGLHVIMDGFGLATVITLLYVFPFDFSVIPNAAAQNGTNIGVTVCLIMIAVGFGISLLARFIKLLISSSKALFKIN